MDSSEEKKKISKNYVEIYKGKYDSYHFFTYLGIKLLKINGIIGYIIPDTWTILQQTEKLRESRDQLKAEVQILTEQLKFARDFQTQAGHRKI